MRELKKEEMKLISGGGGITSTMVNAVYRVFDLMYSIGESLGSYIIRKYENKICDV